MQRYISILILLSFVITGQIGQCPVYAQDLVLPAPGTMVHLSPVFNPPTLKGIKVHPDNPFQFDFILDKGDSVLTDQSLKDESAKLIKYFLASLTVPEKDLWVNLSPYEKDRIVPESFGQTEMGRDLLAQDYLLKQITASLIYPEDEVGKKFWKRIYEEAQKKFGTTNIPVNTFNKVWIVPQKAVVYENAKAHVAYVVESKLKVMLEQDYLSAEKHEGSLRKETNQIGSQIVREVVIPELTKEINEGKNFNQLRQVYNSLILATWYKKKIKDSILSQVYADKNKVQGINLQDINNTEAIYQQYLQAFKKGAYNLIKEEKDPITQETIPRKYFSGGFSSTAMIAKLETTRVEPSYLPDHAMAVQVDLVLPHPETFMNAMEFPSVDPDGYYQIRRAVLLADSSKSVLVTGKSSRRFLLGRVKQGQSTTAINAVESFDEEYYKLKIIYGRDVKETGEVVISNNQITAFFPYSIAQDDLDGSGVADIVIKYLFTASITAGRSLASDGQTNFGAIRSYLRQALVYQHPWPQFIAFKDLQQHLSKWHSVQDRDIIQTLFDLKNLGYVCIGGKKWSRLSLSGLGNNLYRVDQVLDQDSEFRVGDVLEISAHDFNVFVDKKRVGKVLIAENKIMVRGAYPPAKIEHSSTNTTEAIAGAIAGSGSLEYRFQQYLARFGISLQEVNKNIRRGYKGSRSVSIRTSRNPDSWTELEKLGGGSLNSVFSLSDDMVLRSRIFYDPPIRREVLDLLNLLASKKICPRVYSPGWGILIADRVWGQNYGESSRRLQVSGSNRPLEELKDLFRRVINNKIILVDIKSANFMFGKMKGDLEEHAYFIDLDTERSIINKSELSLAAVAQFYKRWLTTLYTRSGGGWEKSYFDALIKLFDEFATQTDGLALPENFELIENLNTFSDSAMANLDSMKWEWSNQATVQDIVEAKIRRVNELLERESPSKFPSSDRLIRDLNQAGIKVAVGTANERGRKILTDIGLSEFLDVIVDGTTISEEQLPPKETPDFYKAVARKTGIQDLRRSVIIEDSPSVIKAAARGGFGLIIGLAREGDEEQLDQAGANIVLKDIGDLSVEDINRLLANELGLDEEERVLEGVMFDMDGVIIDSEPQHARAWEEVLNSYVAFQEREQKKQIRRFTGQDNIDYLKGVTPIVGVTGFLKSRGITLNPENPAQTSTSSVIEAYINQNTSQAMFSVIQDIPPLAAGEEAKGQDRAMNASPTPNLKSGEVPFQTIRLKMDANAHVSRIHRDPEEKILKDLETFAQANNLNLEINDTNFYRTFSITQAIWIILENLIQHEYFEENGLEQDVYYRIYKTDNGARLEFWGPGKHHPLKPHLIDTASDGEKFRWFDGGQRPWKEEIAPPDAVVEGRTHLGISTLFDNLDKADKISSDKKIKMGWRHSQEMGGHIIAIEFPDFGKGIGLAGEAEFFNHLTPAEEVALDDAIQTHGSGRTSITTPDGESIKNLSVLWQPLFPLRHNVPFAFAGAKIGLFGPGNSFDEAREIIRANHNISEFYIFDRSKKVLAYIQYRLNKWATQEGIVLPRMRYRVVDLKNMPQEYRTRDFDFIYERGVFDPMHFAIGSMIQVFSGVRGMLKFGGMYLSSGPYAGQMTHLPQLAKQGFQIKLIPSEMLPIKETTVALVNDAAMISSTMTPEMSAYIDEVITNFNHNGLGHEILHSFDHMVVFNIISKTDGHAAGHLSIKKPLGKSIVIIDGVDLYDPQQRGKGYFSALLKTLANSLKAGWQIGLYSVTNKDTVEHIIEHIVSRKDSGSEFFKQEAGLNILKIHKEIQEYYRGSPKEPFFKKYNTRTTQFNQWLEAYMQWCNTHPEDGLRQLKDIILEKGFGRVLQQNGFKDIEVVITGNQLNIVGNVDKAISSVQGEAAHIDHARLTKTGGIDLTSKELVETKNDGREIKFKMDPAMLKQLQDAPGFAPVIINIQPMTDLRQFLGLKDQEKFEVIG